MMRFPLRLTLAAGLLAASPALAQLQVSINPAERHQTIEGMGFAAVGTWWQQVADLYNDPAFADRIRDDLGASMIRVEIPPAIEQNPDPYPEVIDWGYYDFSPMYAAGHFATLLNQGHPGAVKVAGSIWSPPWWMKTNQSEVGGGYLRTDRYPHFGKYVACASMGFEFNFGVPMYAVSIQNEPVFAEPYVSCVYTEQEYSDTLHAVSDAFTRWGLTRTKTFGAEDTGGPDPNRTVNYVNAIAGDPISMQRLDAVAVHQFPWENGVCNSSPAAWQWLLNSSRGKPLWVSEISGERQYWVNTVTFDWGALWIAREIHDALVYGNVTAWLYWELTDIDPTTDQSLMILGEPTNKYYSCKQFFRYVRPDAVRIGASGGTADVLVSAYTHEQQQTMTVVLVNMGGTASPVHLDISATPGLHGFQTIRSSETEQTVTLADTSVSNGQADLTLPPYSIVTLYGSTATAPTCYANCDGSTSAPILNVADFICFQQRYAAGDPAANCDHSTNPPILNISDFICFQQAFAAGCP